MEGLLSTGPTLSSYRYRYSVTLKNLDKIKHIRIVQKVCQMLSQNFIKHFHNEKNSLFLACLISFFSSRFLEKKRPFNSKYDEYFLVNPNSIIFVLCNKI